MKILLSAIACNPMGGSEQGAGWAWASAASQDHRVWLLTGEDNRESIEAQLSMAPNPHITVIYFEPSGRIVRWLIARRVWGLRPVVWQLAATSRAAQLHKVIGFDLAHHVTMASDWMPAAVARVKGLPYVWGPVGGWTRAPWGLWRHLGIRGIAQELARYPTVPLLRLAFGRRQASGASLVIAQNEDVAARWRARTRRQVVRPNAVIDLAEGLARTGMDCPVDLAPVVFAGRLLRYKGCHLAIEAYARSLARGSALHIYGAGPERLRLEALAESLGVGSEVIFYDRQPREAVLRAMTGAALLLLPSMRDAAGWAVAEAATIGCPVVCIAVGGPAVLVRPLNGRAVTPTPAGSLVPRLAAAIDYVVNSRVPYVPTTDWTPDALREALADFYGVAVEVSSANA